MIDLNNIDDAEYKKQVEDLRRFARKLIRYHTALKNRGITGDDILNDVVKKMLESESFQKKPADRASYLRKCIKNKVIDNYRKISMEASHVISKDDMEIFGFEPDDDYTVPPDERTMESILDGICDHVKKTGELISASFDSDDPSADVYYRSVLLFQLRMELANRLKAGDYDSSYDEHQRTLGEIVEWMVRWDDDVKKSSFRKGWLTLQKSWKAVRPAVDSDENRLTAAAFCRIYNEKAVSSGSSAHLDAERWYQWIRRGRTLVEKKISDKEGYRLFRVWFRGKQARKDGESG